MALIHKLLDVTSAQFKFNGDTGQFEGYASVFDGVDSYGDTIMAGAFRKTLENRDRAVRMRWNHFGPVIGKWMELMEDSKGLYVRGELTPGHSVAEDVKASLKHGAIDGLSIGFYLDDYEDKPGGGREIRSLRLVEISVVEEPADLGAKIDNIKSALVDATRYADVEQILRDAGHSRADATALVSCIKSLAIAENERKNRDADISKFLGEVKIY